VVAAGRGVWAGGVGLPGGVPPPPNEGGQPVLDGSGVETLGAGTGSDGAGDQAAEGGAGSGVQAPGVGVGTGADHAGGVASGVPPSVAAAPESTSGQAPAAGPGSCGVHEDEGISRDAGQPGATSAGSAGGRGAGASTPGSVPPQEWQKVASLATSAPQLMQKAIARSSFPARRFGWMLSTIPKPPAGRSGSASRADSLRLPKDPFQTGQGRRVPGSHPARVRSRQVSGPVAWNHGCTKSRSRYGR